MPGMTTHCVAEERTALYRFYDGQGKLLYAGITNDPWRRWREHVRGKPWYPQVKHQAVTWYDSEWQARRAETRAIRAELPEFNIAGAVKPLDRFAVGRELAVIVAAIWIGIPVACNFAARWLPLLAHVQVWVMYSSPVPVLVMLSIIGTPWIYRFGCWLNRNFGDDVYREGPR
jgi:predicted GIY-YIG superfamily endonuclease